jgi:hypothetical protein
MASLHQRSKITSVFYNEKNFTQIIGKHAEIHPQQVIFLINAMMSMNHHETATNGDISGINTLFLFLRVAFFISMLLHLLHVSFPETHS